jgi:hypothetical protein
MSETVQIDEAFFRKMLSSRVFYSDDFWYKRRSHHQIGFAVTIFMAIRLILIRKMLMGEMSYYADGAEIQRVLDPDFKGFAFYWLTRPEVDKALKLLIDSGVVVKRHKNSGPQGYGCDQLFSPSETTFQLMEAAAGKGNIKLGITNMLEHYLDKN